MMALWRQAQTIQEFKSASAQNPQLKQIIGVICDEVDQSTAFRNLGSHGGCPCCKDLLTRDSRVICVEDRRGVVRMAHEGHIDRLLEHRLTLVPIKSITGEHIISLLSGIGLTVSEETTDLVQEEALA